MKINLFIPFFLVLLSLQLKSQTTAMSGLDKGLEIGNILVQGYMVLERNGSKPADPNAKTVDSFCFKIQWKKNYGKTEWETGR